MKKYLKPALWALLALFILAQFIRPEKNQSGDTTYSIAQKYPVPEDVQSILKTACYDCHSNYTRYPWYNNIQPVASWLHNHIEEGKHHLNFDHFTSAKIAFQNHHLKEIVEQVKEGEMPLSSYTLIHRDAVLSDEQKARLTNWATSLQDSIKMHYPADSLVMPKRPRRD